MRLNMSLSEPATNKLDEGPGPSTGGIVKFKILKLVLLLLTLLKV